MFKQRKPNRLKVYDYSLPGYYFVTICTDDKGNIIGGIIDEKMILNGFGIIIDQNLKLIPEINETIELDFFVVMPNHIHAIIIINVGDAKIASTT